jgi:hypothetical protein
MPEIALAASAGEPMWRTAGRCDGGRCATMATRGEHVIIRMSTEQDVKLILSRSAWMEFVARVREDR